MIDYKKKYDQLAEYCCKLEERIDKAIEYVNDHSYNIHKVELYRFEIDELLEILKGDENEK